MRILNIDLWPIISYCERLGREWELGLTVQETRLSDGRDGREVMVMVVVVVGVVVLVVVVVVCWKMYQLISGRPSAVIWCGKQFKIIRN